MKIRIISIGKIKDTALKSLIDEYTKRINSYVKIESCVLEDEPIPKNSNDKEEEIVKIKEGKKVLSRLQKDDYVILLDLRGVEMDSLTFASKIEELKNNGTIKCLTFVIGGSLGLSQELRERANEKISLSRMTFTHQMTKYLLLEQIYRACKINNHETYHK